MSSLEPYQQPQQSSISQVDEEIDLRLLAGAIWRGKWVIIFISVFFAVSSVFYALSIPDEYESKVILAPASTSSSSSLSSLAGQFGGLASFAGVNFGAASGGDKTTIAIELIKTWSFLEKFIRDNKIEVEVFAVKGWDKNTKKLIINENLYDSQASAWVKKSALDTKNVDIGPSSWQLYQRIKDRISISQNAKTGLISLSVVHFSPVVAKRWVDLLVVAINKHMQLQDRKEALNSIEYLTAQIESTSIAEMRTIFYQLIEEQTKTLMLAEISSEYVFRTLSQAKVAEVKTKPNRALIVVFWTIFGVLVSVMSVLARYLLPLKNK